MQQKKGNGQWYNNRYDCEANGHEWIISRLGLNDSHPLLQPGVLPLPDCARGNYRCRTVNNV